jgi:hypothetical protein
VVSSIEITHAFPMYEFTATIDEGIPTGDLSNIDSKTLATRMVDQSALSTILRPESDDRTATIVDCSSLVRVALRRNYVINQIVSTRRIV